jgi:rod shape-determining protein MreD
MEFSSSSFAVRVRESAPLILLWLYMFLLLFLNISSLPLLDMGTLTPAFLLMGVFFWSLYWSQAIPLWSLFLIGFALDLLAGGLVGLNALCFCMVSLLILSQTRFLKAQNWLVIWVSFMVAVVLVLSIQFLLVYMFQGGSPPLYELALSALISTLAYPLMMWPMHWINRLRFAMA